jgi:trans-aconitate methyltransferase
MGLKTINPFKMISFVNARLRDVNEKIKDMHNAITDLRISESEFNKATEREIQLTAVTHLPLLTGDLVISDGAVEVRGRARVQNNLYENVRFFINGYPFEELDYPIPENDPRLFSELGGAMAFRAKTTQNIDKISESDFFRIDASPFGVYQPSAWSKAMWFKNPRKERLPMPPPSNIQRVIGDDSSTRFGMGGVTIFQNIYAFISELGLSWSNFERILDWGCGAGRVTRYLISETNSEIHGVDIDADNISWCKQNLAGGHFSLAPLSPPTNFEPGMFNMVIGTSVVTHLTEPMQFAWLRELRRITMPGSLLFLSISGACQFAHLGLEPTLFKKTQKAGILDHARDSALDGFVEKSDYYRSTWHSHRYIVDTWSDYFDVVVIVNGMAALQDFVVLRRKSDSVVNSF